MSERGREESQKVGQKLEGVPVVKPYSSDTERTRETAQIIVGNAKARDKKDLMIRNDLAAVYDDESDFAEQDQQLKRDIMGPNPDELAPVERAIRFEELGVAQTDRYHDFGDNRPDPGTYSPSEAASLLAQRIDRNIRMADKLDNGSNIELVNATHDISIAAFLWKLIGFSSVREIGGPVNFIEGFEVMINTGESGEKTAVLSILRRDHEGNLIKQEGITLDPEKIHALAGMTREIIGEENTDERGN